MNLHQPHCSPALVRLQRGTLLSAWVLALTLIVQTTVFGFVHFTQARFEGPVADASTSASGAAPKVILSTTADAPANPETATPAAPVLSRWDGVMRQFSDLACGIGLIAGAFFVLHVALGVVVSAGANLPGADRVVSAAAWAATIALVCAPWRDVFNSMPFAGVFCGYGQLTTMSDASHASGADFSIVFNCAFLPAAALFATVWATLQYRLGVDAGVIVTHLSQIDEKIQREMSETATRGVGSNVGPRSAGSLHAAIGETPSHPRTPEEIEAQRIARGLARGETLKKAAGAEGLSRRPI